MRDAFSVAPELVTILTFTVLVWLGSLIGGFIGALTGLGRGVAIVPLLFLAFGTNIRYAVGASVVSVIATSSGAPAAYDSEGYCYTARSVLEVATTIGALAGINLYGRIGSA